MSRVKIIFVFCMLIIVGACSLAEPFVDRRREAGQIGELLYVGRSRPESPAICYNSWATDFAVVQKMADEECVEQEKGVRAEFVDDAIFSCRLLTPTYANFKCVEE